MVISNIYFIRLGAKNSYAEECLKNNTLKLGFTTNQHKESLKGEWDKLRQHWIKEGKSKGKATEYMHETKIFYEADDSVLWITIVDHFLYWAFSKKKSLKEIEGGYRIRTTFNKWQKTSFDEISRNKKFTNVLNYLNRLKSYPGTICNVQEKDAILDLISDKSGITFKIGSDFIVGSEGESEWVTKHKTGLESKRDKSFVTRFKIKYNYRQECEGCGQNQIAYYKMDPIHFFELHHLEKYSSKRGSKSHIIDEFDFALLCPNCHCKIHDMMRIQKTNYIPLSKLKKAIG